MANSRVRNKPVNKLTIRQISRFFALIGTFLLVSLSTLLYASPETDTLYLATGQLSKQQRDFLQSYETLKKGEIVDPEILNGLKNYPLYPYLDYIRIKRRINSVSEQTLERFIRRHPNSYLADRLMLVWLSRKILRQQWQSVIDFHRPGKGGITAECYFLEAKIQLALRHKHPELKQHLTDAKTLWLSGKRRPSACNSLFKLLKQKGWLDDEAYWNRIGRVIAVGNTRLARELAKHTNDQTKELVHLWIKLRKEPLKYLDDELLKAVHSTEEKTPQASIAVKQLEERKKELIVYGLKRLARKKTAQARAIWHQRLKQYNFSAAQQGDVESYFTYRDALDLQPHALRKLAGIPANYRSQDATIWMARLAIRSGDWKKYREAYLSMSAESRKKDNWRYWQAHSLDRSGKKQLKQQAEDMFRELATDASFYGFLAADRLKLPYQRLLEPEKDWSRCRTKIADLGAIQRAVEWFALGNPVLAKKEWFWALKHLNKTGQLAAAEYARHIGQPFLAILTISKTRDWNQVGLRFPLEYQSLVESSAKTHRISPAWIYGIMRRESAFDPKIVSSAKAQGLMQVLPSTAKSVAKKLGINDHKKSDLLIPEKNAHIGSAYLSGLLKRFKGNYSKATAAYNAGPSRVIKWAPDFYISAPRWIESIPFTETRKYVRAVLSYTTIYDHKLNHHKKTNLRLSKRLRPIGPN